MKEITLAVLISVVGVPSGSSSGSKPGSDINAKVAQLNIETATLDDVIRIFGEPTKYLWRQKTFTKANLPSTYIAAYPNGFNVVVSNGRVGELRFESPAAGYVYRDKLTLGSSLDEVLKVVGQPTETLEGQALPGMAKDSVLYKDINSRKGYCYYSRRDQGVRFFFLNYKVSSLYLTGSGPVGGKGRSFRSIQPIRSVKAFDDVRWKDMSKLDLSERKDLIATLTFNQKTVWPDAAKMPPDGKPEEVLKDAMNPGLGVRDLHQQGITGKGVNVAIIDQPLYLDHPEFAGKILAYHDTGCGSQSSMHGPAVASLLVGANCGTAPDARVYYAAAPSWKRDTAYEAKALDWIVAQNRDLSASKKIRVVSVSAAPSGPGAPRDKNQHMWDQACARAEAAGILVLDCTGHHGFIGPCWYDARAAESVTRCTPGFRGRRWAGARPGRILVPSSPRTTAEQYDEGGFGYQYCGRGGLSWAIPYCAGVLALGWQVNPNLGPEQMRDLLFKSAYTKKSGARIIYPKKFIQLVKNAKAAPWGQAPKAAGRR
jgi:subtilisin family serine protease